MPVYQTTFEAIGSSQSSPLPAVVSVSRTSRIFTGYSHVCSHCHDGRAGCSIGISLCAGMANRDQHFLAWCNNEILRSLSAGFNLTISFRVLPLSADSL